MKSLILKTLKDVILRIFILLDVFLDRALFRGRLETISSRAGRAKCAGRTWGVVLCKFLNWLDPGHCENAMNDPLGRLD